MLRAHVDFSRKLRDWDGFGVCFTDKATVDPEEYFTLNEHHQRFLQEFFGSNGLRMGIVKMFIDPFRLNYCQQDSDEDQIVEVNEYHFYDLPSFHAQLARYILEVARNGGVDLKIILSGLCPPAWMTRQKELSGRDLDPVNRIHYSRYMVAWARYLSVTEKLPVYCLSLHSRGEMWQLWDSYGIPLYSNTGMNLYWSPEMVVDFLKLIRRQLDHNGLEHIGLSPGDTKNWGNFYDWGYADLISEDPLALKAVSLLTSNANLSGNSNDFCSTGIDLIHEKRPDLHAWVTADELRNIRPGSISALYKLIYRTKVNSVILSTTIKNKDSSFSQSKDLSFLKPVCKAGQPGMGVCQVGCNGSDIFIIGFSSNSTGNTDSFVLINDEKLDWNMPIEIRGSASAKFSVYRTSVSENFLRLEDVTVKEGKIHYLAPAKSVSGFYTII